MKRTGLIVTFYFLCFVAGTMVSCHKKPIQRPEPPTNPRIVHVQ